MPGWTARAARQEAFTVSKLCLVGQSIFGEGSDYEPFWKGSKGVPAKKAKKVGDALPKVGRSYGQPAQLVHLQLEDTSREILRALQKNTQNLFKREYLQSKRLMPLSFKSF